MKTTIFFAVMMLVTLFAAGQSNNNNAFGINTAKCTLQNITVEGVDYPVWQCKTGTEFIRMTSARTNNPYPVWIGQSTDETAGQYPVRMSKNGRRFILKHTSEKNVIAVYLDAPLASK